ALSRVTPPTPLCGLGRHRSGLRDGDRFPPETVGHVLDRPRSQRHSGPALLPSQRPLRELLGEPTRRLTFTSMSHTLSRRYGEGMASEAVKEGSPKQAPK